MASMDFPGGSYNPHLQISGVPLAKGSMYKSKDYMYAKLDRKNISIILGIPIWKKVAFARCHCSHDASFFNFPFQLFRGKLRNVSCQMQRIDKLFIFVMRG